MPYPSAYGAKPRHDDGARPTGLWPTPLDETFGVAGPWVFCRSRRHKGWTLTGAAEPAC